MSLCEVSRVYRMGEVEVPALRGVTLDVVRGEFLVVVGPSGSGKSTLLNIVGGMDRPSAGTVTYDNRDLTHASDRELTLFRRREIGFVFQFYNLIPSLTALENVEVAAELTDVPMDPALALAEVGLGERASHFPSQLSGGEQQRVAVARALAGNPSLLLCDEPTGALDSAAARQVLQLLDRLNREKGKTVVIITHNPGLNRLGDRLLALHDGRVAREERIAERSTVEELEL